MPLGFSPRPLRNEKKKDCSFRAPALNREEAGRAVSLKGRHVTKKKEKREAPCETFSHGAPYCEDRTCGGVARSPSRKGRRGVAGRLGGTGARPSDRLGATSLLSSPRRWARRRRWGEGAAFGYSDNTLRSFQRPATEEGTHQCSQCRRTPCTSALRPPSWELGTTVV